MKIRTFLLTAALLLTAGGVQAGEAQSLKAVNAKMMKDMNVPLTGNADRDFVAMMLPHHQGAIDMAKAEIQYGKDPELILMAQHIVRSQQKDIAQMQAWQEQNVR